MEKLCTNVSYVQDQNSCFLLGRREEWGIHQPAKWRKKNTYSVLLKFKTHQELGQMPIIENSNSTNYTIFCQRLVLIRLPWP